jgi:L-2-hydroxyglutarate oxidase LhgO
VIHSGLSYRPGSLKAQLCTSGRSALLAWCRRHGIEHAVTGKLVVATDAGQLGALRDLARRGEANGLAVERLGAQGLRDRAPAVAGVAALHVPATGLVDFATVTRSFAGSLEAAGVELRLGHAVGAIAETRRGVVVDAGGTSLRARWLVVCAGLQADHVARSAGLRAGLRIVPFRGEYHELAHERRPLVPLPVYPVPDPSLPFLGVHLTPHLDGRVTVGPNAVLAAGRERYRRQLLDGEALRSVAELAGDAAVRRMAARWWRAGAWELARSRSTRLLARSVQRLVPDIDRHDLTPTAAGIRAQAVDDQGRLLDDFAIARTPRSVHVLNAPSPAATASLAIGQHLADVVLHLESAT